MVNKPRQRGTAAETAVVRWLRHNGFPGAERIALHGRADQGDVRLTVGCVAEVKSVRAAGTGQPGAALLADWLAQAAAERDNAHADLCPLIVKRAGTGDPARWWAYCTQAEFITLLDLPAERAPQPAAWVCMTLASLAALLRAAGYGEEWPSKAPESHAEPRTGSAGTRVGVEQPAEPGGAA